MVFLTHLIFLGVVLSRVGVESHDAPVGDWMHPQTSHAAGLKEDGKTTEDGQFWWVDAQRELRSMLEIQRVENVAKNVVFFLGDGMSVPTITAARIFKGQKVDNLSFGEEAKLHMDSFPHVAVSKTYCADAQVADSACSATAYLCGVKNNIDMLGVKPSLLWGDCEGQADPVHHVSSILAWAQAGGKSTGIVTTTRVTHATPAGTYAHAADRNWESDRDVRMGGGNASICRDIAYQLVMGEPGRNINVIMGGGRRELMRNNETDPESGAPGEREDGLNLIDEWVRSKERASYVYTKNDLLQVNTSATDFLLGLFAPSDLGYLDEQAAGDDPSLEEMTRVAIEILSRNPQGFFLLVEGGRIDHAHHNNMPQRAMWETIEFDKAIKRGDEMTDDEDTLVVVTADHSHVMSISGYPKRGNPVERMALFGSDGLPYNTLGYVNGPGYRDYVDGVRPDISGDDFDSVSYRPPVGVPLGSETHGGDDVLVLSKGPWAHLLVGVKEQSYIPHVMGFASCVGAGVHAPQCSTPRDDDGTSSEARSGGWVSMAALLCVASTTALALVK